MIFCLFLDGFEGFFSNFRAFLRKFCLLGGPNLATSAEAQNNTASLSSTVDWLSMSMTIKEGDDALTGLNVGDGQHGGHSPTSRAGGLAPDGLSQAAAPGTREAQDVICGKIPMI